MKPCPVFSIPVTPFQYSIPALQSTECRYPFHPLLQCSTPSTTPIPSFKAPLPSYQAPLPSYPSFKAPLPSYPFFKAPLPSYPSFKASLPSYPSFKAPPLSHHPYTPLIPSFFKAPLPSYPPSKLHPFPTLQSSTLSPFPPPPGGLELPLYFADSAISSPIDFVCNIWKLCFKSVLEFCHLQQGVIK